MQEDEVLSKITRLLEKGCTMLAAHHDCGAPLFRCQGEIVCPVCSFADETSLPARAQPSGPSAEGTDARSNPGRARLHGGEEIADKPDDSDLAAAQRSRQGEDEMSKALGGLRSALLARLQELTASVRDERDLHMLKRQLDCLEGLLRILRSLQG
jgi:UPF0148 protein